MKSTLISILREEKVRVEEKIEEERRRDRPDRSRIAALRQEASSLRRQLETIPAAW
ncbi:MAG TPA: hypothetical protein VEB64_01385 [Azospirillaceae bacterium]|nr:hypothetical protein [Azospirillaceae bacterium]